MQQALCDICKKNRGAWTADGWNFCDTCLKLKRDYCASPRLGRDCTNPNRKAGETSKLLRVDGKDLPGARPYGTYGSPNNPIFLCGPCDNALAKMKVTCNACDKVLLIANKRVSDAQLYSYGGLSFCDACWGNGPSTCDRARLGGSCAAPTAGGSAQLFKVGQKTYYAGRSYPYTIGGQTITLCQECETAISPSKVTCSGCNALLKISGYSLNVPTANRYVGWPEDLVFCANCFINTSKKCDVCHSVPVAKVLVPKEGELLKDVTRSSYAGETVDVCVVCKRRVLSDGQARQYYQDIYSQVYNKLSPYKVFDMPPLEIVGPKNLVQILKQSTQGHLYGFWDPNQRKIFMRTCLTKAEFLSTEAHELAHAWHNALLGQASGNMNKKTKEGFAQWVAYKVLESWGRPIVDATNSEEVADVKKAQSSIENDASPDYGAGFRAFQALENSSSPNQALGLIVQAAQQGIDAVLTTRNIPIPQ